MSNVHLMEAETVLLRQKTYSNTLHATVLCNGGISSGGEEEEALSSIQPHYGSVSIMTLYYTAE